MGKNKNNEINNKNALPKADTEFAKENGFKKIALKAQKNENK
jgi:hypothetical protein